MSERTIYTCDLCKKESTDLMHRGVIYYKITVGSLNYHARDLTSEDSRNDHTCHACLDILGRELDSKAREVISKLMQDLMG